MRYAIMILALVGVLASPRPAAALTGNDLLERCSKDGEKWFWCHGFVVGWAQRQRIAAADPKAEKYACLPTGAPFTQLMDVLIKALKNHPEVRHKDAAILVTLAFKEAFPCPKN